MCRRPARIGHRFDRTEDILAGAAGEKPPITLKICILLGVPPEITGVKINTIVIALPDLNQRVADRFPARVEHTPTEPGYFADGRCDSIIDDEQVVIRVEREFVRVKRTLGQAWGSREFFCKCAGRGQ